MAENVPSRRPNQIHRSDAQVRARRLECPAPRPVRRLGLSTAGCYQPQRAGRDARRRRIPPRRATAPGPVARHGDHAAAWTRLHLHHQGTTRSLNPGMVGCPSAPRSIRSPHRRALYPRFDLSRCCVTAVATAWGTIGLMELYDVMRSTPAVREFTDDPLPDDVLGRILDSARFAPTGGNRQGVRVVVLRDQDTRSARATRGFPAARRYTAQLANGESPWNPLQPP